MKKIKFIAALAIMMGFTMGAMAQQNDNAVTAAKAEVIAQVVVEQVQDLIFGMITPGNTKTINTEGGLSAGIAGTGTTIGEEKVGQFSVTKGLNTQVTLGFTLPTNLVYSTPNPDENLAINFTDAGSVKLAKLSKFNGNQSDLLFTPGTGLVVANATTTAEYFTDNDFYVFIGGTVVPVNGQVAGVYEGQITLTATYN